MAQKFDLVVVGGGTSGLEAAKTAAENGLRVALLERKTHPAKIQRSCAQMFLHEHGLLLRGAHVFFKGKEKMGIPGQ